MVKDEFLEILEFLQEEQLFTVEEVAKLIHISTKSVYHAIRTGRLAAVKLGPRSLRVQSSNLAEFLKQAGYQLPIKSI
jgi:excisionase family DNA binding protein